MKLKLRLVLALISMFFATGIAFADFEKGIEAFFKEDFKTAFTECSHGAENGDAKAMALLGDVSLVGLALKKTRKLDLIG